MRYFLAFAIALLLSSSAWAKLVEEVVEYKDGEATLEGLLVYDGAAHPRPGVLVIHEWWGINDYIRERARQVASLGYIAFAPDVYGKGVRPESAEAAGKEAGRYMKDRALLRSRVKAGLEELKKKRMVDPERVAAVGYCFGGAAALELARSGAPVAATVTFHAPLASLSPRDAANIKGRVLVLHGAADPFVKEADLASFTKSMNDAGVDWRMTSFGGVVHGFTNAANGTDPSDGIAYDANADSRSWEEMKGFLAETVGSRR